LRITPVIGILTEKFQAFGKLPPNSRTSGSGTSSPWSGGTICGQGGAVPGPRSAGASFLSVFLKFHLPRSMSPAVNRSCYTFDVISHSFSFPSSDGHSAALPCPRLNEGFANCRRGPNACGKACTVPNGWHSVQYFGQLSKLWKNLAFAYFFWAMWKSQESRLGPLQPDAALLQRRHQSGLARPALHGSSAVEWWCAKSWVGHV